MDLISRAEAIGLIRGMYPSEPVLPSNRRKWEEKYEQFIRVEREISRLPSVQPEQEGLSGWVCPVCGRGLSPFTSICPCNNGKGWEITC